MSPSKAMAPLTSVVGLVSLLVLGVCLMAPSATGQGVGFFDISPSDLEDHLNNAAQLEYYLKCVTGDDLSCDARGRQLRRIMPELSLSPGDGLRCSVCNDTEFKNLKRVVSVLQTRYPVCWVSLNKVLNQVRRASAQLGYKRTDQSRSVVDCTRKAR